MGNEAKETPGTVTGADAKPSGTGVGPGRPPSRRRKGLWRILGVGVILAIVVISIALYRYYAVWESTDDAQIDGYIYPVSSRIPGYVTRVTVDDNQYVEAGTVLVQLDMKDYEVALANAKAALANAQASAASVSITVPLTSVNTSSQLSSAVADVQNANAALIAAQHTFDAAEASLRQAEANDLKAQDDVSRYKPLAAKDEIPQQRYTQAVESEKATAAAVETARASSAATEQSVAQAQAKVEQTQAQLRYAQTAPQQISAQRSRAEAAAAETQRAATTLEQAQLNLEYTTIVAPVSGVVGQRSVHPGQTVSPGQQLMTIVPLDSPNIWVTANFKETQLAYMQSGQPVKVSVDAYSRIYDGHVLNFAGASGALYSLLPAENAKGDYDKVLKRGHYGHPDQ